jgi:hypothetical protein
VCAISLICDEKQPRVYRLQCICVRVPPFTPDQGSVGRSLLDLDGREKGRIWRVDQENVALGCFDVDAFRGYRHLLYSQQVLILYEQE